MTDEVGLPLVVAALLLGLWQLAVSRRSALIPIVVAAYHVPDLQVLDFGASALRLALLAGLVRVLFGRVPLKPLATDKLFVMWAVILLTTAGGHENAGTQFVLRAGLVFDTCAAYLIARWSIRSFADVERLAAGLAVVLVPLAVLMLAEKFMGWSLYQMLGASFYMVRPGGLRAAGPFGNAILAGTAAAALLPMFLFLLKSNRRALGLLGVTSCLSIVFASSSSGPYVTMVAALAAVAAWPLRTWVPALLALGVVVIFALALVMNDPVWYVMARIDIAGGSTGFHRAELITQAMNHIGDWWLLGTDYTRHWLPYGIPGRDAHVDITNHYLKLGVMGGVALMVVFIAILVATFRLLVRLSHEPQSAGKQERFALWCLGAALVAHCVSFTGVSYFDQSYVLFIVLIGMIAGLAGAAFSPPQPIAADTSAASSPDANFGQAGEPYMYAETSSSATTAKRK
jgi:hypothetical protein